MKLNKSMILEYSCGCCWWFVMIPFEHWRPEYCKKHESVVIKEFDRINKLTDATRCDP